MADDSDPTAPASTPSTHLGYAIRSARAVVHALIARNRDAAEEAALRTCRDCDLLIHLLTGLVSVLRDPCNEQLGLSPRETLILARRAEQVLALVDEQEPDGQSLTRPTQFQGAAARAQQLHVRSVARRPRDDADSVSPLLPTLTVASTGLRVRLIPVDDAISRPTDEDRGNDRPGPATGTPWSRLGER